MTAPKFAGMENFAYTDDATVRMEYQFENGDTFWIDIRENGSSNTKYNKLRASIFKPHLRQIENDTLSEEKFDELRAELYAKAVIVDWGGICDPNGKPIPCNQDNAKVLMTSYPRLANRIVEDASTESNFTGGNGPAVKNSQAPSDGGSSGASN